MKTTITAIKIKIFTKLLLSAAAGILIFGGVGSVSAQSAISISVAPESKVVNDIVLLSDIAEISAGDRSDALRQISLGYAPNIGMTRDIPRDRIELAIAATGISASEFTLKSPALVRIRRAGQLIEGEKVRAAVENAISRQFSESRVEFRIIRLDTPENFDAAVGDVEIRANLANVANPFAPFSVPVEIRVNDRIFRRFSVRAELEATVEILVANKDLAVNSKLSKDDVRIERRRIDKPLANYLRDPEMLRGIYLIKNLSGGMEITADSFAAAFVVKSGDLIRIVGQSGKMQITVNGEARSSGKIGDRIAVKNSQSNKIIQATVIDEGIVKVYF